MRKTTKVLIVYALTLSLSVLLAMQLAQAQESYEIEVIEEVNEQTEPLDQAELDAILAPIALYPDTLLSHIFIASTLPLEVIQAARWQEQHAELETDELLALAEEQPWDPSIKALLAFPDLLARMNQDLDWLAALGHAFSRNEGQVLASVQSLREKAYAQGNLQDNDYIDVIEEDDEIIIQPVHKEVVYVPYYDTRVVYGNWWHHHQPYYWHRPAHYYWYAGFYWSPRIYVRLNFFDFGRVHWHKRHVVINHPYHYKTYRKPYHQAPAHKGYVHWRKNAHKHKTRKYARSNAYQKAGHRQIKQRLVSHQQHKHHAEMIKDKRRNVIKTSPQQSQQPGKQVEKTYQTEKVYKSSTPNKSVQRTNKRRQQTYYANNSYKSKSSKSYRQSHKSRSYQTNKPHSAKVRNSEKRAHHKMR